VEKCIFETNVAQTVALKFADGKRVESRYNEYEQYYSLVDGRALYASPALHQKIESFAPQPGELFTITKAEIRDGQRKRIEWQVAPASDAQEAPATPAPAAPRLVTPAPKPAPAPEPVSAPGTMTQIVGGAFVAAIDALDQASKYAESKGIALIWSPEDYRSVASTIVIQFFKDRETRVRYGGTTTERVNGGAAWQQ
jgi:hypothetical protein